MSLEGGAFGQSVGGGFIESPAQTARAFGTGINAVISAPRFATFDDFSEGNVYVRLEIGVSSTLRWRDTTDSPPLDNTIKAAIFDAMVGAYPGQAGTFDTLITSGYVAAEKHAAVVRDSDTVLFIELTKPVEFDRDILIETVTWTALPALAFVASTSGIVPTEPMTIQDRVSLSLTGVADELFLRSGGGPYVFQETFFQHALDCPGAGCSHGGGPFSTLVNASTSLTGNILTGPSNAELVNPITRYRWILAGTSSGASSEICCFDSGRPLVNLSLVSGYLERSPPNQIGYTVAWHTNERAARYGRFDFSSEFQGGIRIDRYAVTLVIDI